MGVETTGAGVGGGVAAGGVLPKPAPALVVVVVLPEPAAGTLDALVVPAACVVVLPATGVALPELTVVAVALALPALVLVLVLALALASLEFVPLEEVEESEALEPSPPHPASASKLAARNQCGRLSVWRNVMMSLVNRCVIDARNPCLRETRYYRRRTRQTCLKRATFGPVQVAKVMEILRSPSRSAVKRR